MKHLLLKAATTATDEGTFEAVISTASVDRDGDIVEPVAIVKALAKWAALGKLVPLAYSHFDPASGQTVVVGHIDPASARAEGSEVVTKGWVDQSTERGAETWRLVKSGTLSFSYGYLVPEGGAAKRAGKKTGYHVTEIDLYEISVVPVAPANNDTRVLSWKSAKDAVMSPPSPAPVRMGTSRAVANPDDLLNGMLLMAQDFIDTEPDDADVQVMREVVDRLQALSDTEDTEDTAGEAKAVWTTAYINNLPDSAFLYIEPGGSKDSEGKTTPRSLRHFPVRDASGTPDPAHVRNALSRIPQSSLSQSVKDTATAKAQRMLDAMKAVDVDATDKGPTRARSEHSLRKRHQEILLETQMAGISRWKSPPVEEEDEPELPSQAELRRRAYDLTLRTLMEE